MPVEQSFRQFKKNIFRTTYSSIRYLSREEAIRICQFAYMSNFIFSIYWMWALKNVLFTYF